MFGEYALVCDDQVFGKPTQSGPAHIEVPAAATAYPCALRNCWICGAEQPGDGAGRILPRFAKFEHFAGGFMGTAHGDV